MKRANGSSESDVAVVFFDAQPKNRRDTPVMAMVTLFAEYNQWYQDALGTNYGWTTTNR